MLFRLYDGSPFLDSVIDPTLSLIRRVILSLDTVQQTSFVHLLLSSLISLTSPTNKLFLSIACNALVFLDKSSALFTAHTSGTDPSDIISMTVDMALSSIEGAASNVAWQQFGSAQIVAILVNKVS